MRSIRDSRRVLAATLAGTLFALLLIAPATLRIAVGAIAHIFYEDLPQPVPTDL